VFFGGKLFAKEVTFWTGYAGGKEIRNAWVIGTDPLLYNVSKDIILGFRTYVLTADRKEYKIGNAGCNYWSIMVGGRYQTKISKNFEFNTKFFTGTGSYERKVRVRLKDNRKKRVIQQLPFWVVTYQLESDMISRESLE
jgi:hypothetical protein